MFFTRCEKVEHSQNTQEERFLRDSRKLNISKTPLQSVFSTLFRVCVYLLRPSLSLVLSCAWRSVTNLTCPQSFDRSIAKSEFSASPTALGCGRIRARSSVRLVQLPTIYDVGARVLALHLRQPVATWQPRASSRRMSRFRLSRSFLHSSPPISLITLHDSPLEAMCFHFSVSARQACSRHTERSTDIPC